MTEPTAPFRDSDRQGAALLLIDVVNRFDFVGGAALEAAAQAIVEPILSLRRAADAAHVPTVYVNDHFGEWHAEKDKLVARAREGGGAVVARLAPREQDYFIIKPQLSGFYATNLPLLLPKLGARRLILAGLAADACVLFTAGDAHMRDYALWVPADAVAARCAERRDQALAVMREQLGADTRPTGAVDPAHWFGDGASPHDTR